MTGAIAVLIAGVMWVQYLWRIPRERIPRRPWGSLTAAAAAVIVGALSGSWWGWLAAVIAAYFWFLTLTSGYRPASGREVGDQFPELTARDSEGALIRSSDWSGRRVLFKLYRGPW